MGLLAGIVTLWATFAPCFLWIFAGAPWIDWIGERPRLSSALAAITAAVVGVILNLSIWFALHVYFAEVTVQTHGPVVLWTPTIASIDWKVVALSIACGVLLLRMQWGVAKVLSIAALAGIVLNFVAGNF